MSEQLPLFAPTPGIVGRHHPPTARTAAAAIEPATGTLRREVLTYLRACGSEGATDHEMQDALVMPGDTQRPRRVELCAARLVIDSGRQRPGRTGRLLIVWVAT